MVDVARGLSPGETMLPVSQGLLFALTGRRKEAEEALNEIRASSSESITLYGELFVVVALGNLDEAFKILTRQAEAHSWSSTITVDPLFAQVRNDPRYLEFCRKVGIRVPGAPA